MKRIDLHIHTNISDGILLPKQVINEASKNHVQVIAIADHDTTEAYTDELFKYAEEKHIQIIPAVEISTKIEKAGIHVLGYNINTKDEELKKKLFEIRNARHDYLHKVALKLTKLGYIINVNKLDKVDAVTKAHIALDIIQNQKNEKVLINNFGHLPNKGEFIETIMNEGCPAYIRKNTITPKEATNIIRKAGGKVILAHPVAYQYEDNLQEEDILDIVEDMQADGIEANYIYVDRNNNKINDVVKWRNFASKHNLVMTIGSDFHNSDGIHPEIGLINEEMNLSDEEIERIINSLLEK